MCDLILLTRILELVCFLIKSVNSTKKLSNNRLALVHLLQVGLKETCKLELNNSLRYN